MNTKNIIILLLGLFVLSYLHQEIKLKNDKKLETYKVCANNPPYEMENLVTMKNYLSICSKDF